MKKFAIVLLAAALLHSASACGAPADPEIYYEQPIITQDGSSQPAEEKNETAKTGENEAQTTNPVVEYPSLDAANAVAGTKLEAFGGSEESFAVINKETVQYRCVLDGIAFTYRANPYTYEDISGIYGDEGPVFCSFHPGNDEPTAYLCSGPYKLARWFTSSQVQYSLTAEDDGALSEEDFLAVALKCQQTTGVMKPSAYYDNLAGSYYDSNGQNTTMEIVSYGYEGVTITILWNNSAATKDCWTMDARVRDEDGTLAYSNCLHELITFTEDGAETRETIGENICGYFRYDEETGHLLWTGGEEGCEEAVFVLY